jgi:NADH:ubiquinone oxidoreductase subunit 5 (subunit L)/multisubunit Na+/H+ antiporter MnhA subunit
MNRQPADDRRFLVRAGVILVSVVVVGTLAPMVPFVLDENRDAEEALVLMTGPLVLLVLAAVVAGIFAAVQNASRNAQAGRRTSEQGIRVGIVWILGLSLILLVGVFGVLAYRRVELPEGLVALASSLGGGLIGVLAPRGATAPSDDAPEVQPGEPDAEPRPDAGALEA